MAARRVVYVQERTAPPSRRSLGWLGTQAPAPAVVEKMPWRRRPEPWREPAPPLPAAPPHTRLAFLFAPTPGPSPTTAAGSGRPVVARQPSREDATRQKRAMDRLADVFNSLGTAGVLLQTGPHEWVVHPRVFEQTGNPSAANDVTFGAWPGDSWINTAAQTEWVCISNAAGLAVWKQRA